MAANNEFDKSGLELPGAFELARKCVGIFAVANASVLGTLVVSAQAGGTANTFMWVRAVILLGVAGMLSWLVRRAGRGDLSALGRLRVVSTALSIAIPAIDLIPGVCPTWYAGMEGVGALALVGLTVIAWRVAQRQTVASLGALDA